MFGTDWLPWILNPEWIQGKAKNKEKRQTSEKNLTFASPVGTHLNVLLNAWRRQRTRLPVPGAKAGSRASMSNVR